MLTCAPTATPDQRSVRRNGYKTRPMLEDIRTELAARREAAGLSQGHISRIAAVNKSTIHRFEAVADKEASKAPRLNEALQAIIVAYAVALDVDPLELWHRTVTAWLDEHDELADVLAQQAAARKRLLDELTTLGGSRRSS